MEVTRIDLRGGLPTRVTVELTIEELGFLVDTIGSTTYSDREKQRVGYGELGSQVYSGGVVVFNRFWDDGIAGFKRGDTE